MNCDIISCTPHMVLCFLIVIGINILIWLLIYVYIMYDTYKNHSSDLILWKNNNIIDINNTQYTKQYS